MAKRIKELEEELLKMKEKDDCVGDLKEEPGTGSKEKSSMEGAENVNDLEDLSNDLESQKDIEDVVELNEDIKVNIVKDDEEVEGVTLEKMKVGTSCKLAFETKDHVVAWGTIIDSDVEGDNVKVAVDVVVDGDCVIPIPSEQGMYKMSQEVGSHILWPRDLFNTDNIKCPKQSGVVECGYYVMRFMRDIIISRSTSIVQILSMCSMLLKCVVDHEVLIKCVVDKKVLLKCVVHHEVLLKCVVDKKVLLKCVVDYEVLLKCFVDHEVLLKCVLPQSIGAMKPYLRQFIDV
ncbi:hypothetical protein IC582_024446 [Cucumis melo]